MVEEKNFFHAFLLYPAPLLLLLWLSRVPLFANPWTAARQVSLTSCIQHLSESEVAWSCPTLRDPMDCSLPGSSVHGIFQARVMECHFLLQNFSTLLNYINFLALLLILAQFPRWACWNEQDGCALLSCSPSIFNIVEGKRKIKQTWKISYIHWREWKWCHTTVLRVYARQGSQGKTCLGGGDTV